MPPFSGGAVVFAEVAGVMPFLAMVAAALTIAFSALIIRHRLPASKYRRRDDHRPTNVQANFFSSRLRYNTHGPTAEFVVLLATISFIVLIFWIALNW